MFRFFVTLRQALRPSVSVPTSRTVIVLTALSYLCVALGFVYLGRRSGNFAQEAAFCLAWTLVGFGPGIFFINRATHRGQTHAKWLLVMVAALLAVVPEYAAYTMLRWVGLCLMLVVGACAAEMRTRAHFNFAATCITVVSAIVGINRWADWTVWLYLGPGWLFMILALTWDHAASTDISRASKAGLSLVFVGIALLAYTVMHAWAPSPDARWLRILVSGSNVSTPDRITSTQGSAESADHAPIQEQGLLNLAQSNPLKDMVNEVAGTYEGWNWLQRLMPVLLGLALYGAWKRRLRWARNWALRSAWLLAQHRPLWSMHCSVHALEWHLQHLGHRCEMAYSLREHLAVAKPLPPGTRHWFDLALALYGASRFGTAVPTAQRALRLRRTVANGVCGTPPSSGTSCT